MNYDPAEYFRLTSDVPTEEEMDLAEDEEPVGEEFLWIDEETLADAIRAEMEAEEAAAALDREEQR